MSEERLIKIYDTYLNKINPMIVEYETLVQKFPIGVMNEIRALLTHLAKVNLSSDTDEKLKEIGKAEGHVTRLLRDCYKYNCVALENKYRELSDVLSDNEDFNHNKIEILKSHQKATEYLVIARTLEGSIHSDDKADEIYSNFEKAYLLYKEINNKLGAILSNI